MDLSQPQLLKYLSGEISFETWLENQGGQQTTQQEEENTTIPSYQTVNASAVGADVFSSWGSAFTSSTEQEQINIELAYEEEEEGEEDFYQVSNDGRSQSEPITFQMPSFSDVAPQDLDDMQIQGMDLVPIIESLNRIIPTSTIRTNVGRKNNNDHSEPIPDIMQDFQAFQLRKRGAKKGVPIVRRKLPELLRLQMGQANLLVAKGDFKQAADICMEIVREAPSSGLPFKTLAFIYDEQGDQEMSLQYSLISAFLDCKDPHEWRDLANRCLQAGNKKQAMACYDRSCKFKYDDILMQWERASLYFESQDYKKALDIYQILFKILLPSDEQQYIEIGKNISRLYHKLGLTDKAGETLQVAFSVCPSVSDYEGVNMLSEIYIASKKYSKTLKLITSQCGVILPDNVAKIPKQNIQDKEKQSLNDLNNFINKTLEHDFKDITSRMTHDIASSSIDEASTNLLSGERSEKQFTTLQTVTDISGSQNDVSIPSHLPLDLRAKLCVCLIHLDQCSLLEKVITPILLEDVELVGDIILDVGEAYFDTKKYKEALEYLLRLVESHKYNQAAVWLKIAESYDNLGDIEKSIGAYYEVLSLAPLQVNVRLNLASLLRLVERNEEAITVLSEYEDMCTEDDDDKEDNQTTVNNENRLKVEEYELWYKKCMEIYSKNKLRDFIYHGYILMHNYFMSTYTYQKKQTVGKAHIWELLLKILNISVKLKEYRKAINLVEKALLFKPYTESKKYRLELDYLQTTIYFVAGEYSKSFDSFRIILTHESDDLLEKNAVWNLFTQIVNKMLDKRHHRFTLRLLFKRPKLIPLIIQNGNNSLLSGTYKYAIGEFSRAFREWPTYPLNSLLIGISFLHLSCQKFHKTRHTSILHGLIFMFQYLNLREENQEACYNIGRAFHQIGLVHLAVHYYNKALQFPLYNEKLNINPSDVTVSICASTLRKNILRTHNLLMSSRVNTIV